MKDRSRNSSNLGTLFLASPLCFTRCILRGCLLSGLAVIFASAPMLAQNTTADVVGTVSDVSGAVIPNAKIELTNIDTHEMRTVTSGSDGEYTFTLLKPSRYSLTVTAQGFKTFRIESFSLSAGDRAREDPNLSVGATGETITVEGTTPALRTDSAALISTVTEKATQELPLNGRNFINLVQVIPGATEA